MSLTYPYPLSVAPMMGVTDRHYRAMARILSARALLHTEMVVVRADQMTAPFKPCARR